MYAVMFDEAFVASNRLIGVCDSLESARSMAADYMGSGGWENNGNNSWIATGAYDIVRIIPLQLNTMID